MLPDNELDKTSSQLADFRLAHTTHQETLDNVLESYTTLVENYRRLKSDYEEERDAREKYKQLARGQERNPFVLVLVDGDGYIFDDDLVSGGAEGGQRAAQMIGDSVKQSLRLRGLDNCRVMIRIYANLVGLSKALSRVKLAGPEKRSLSPFVANFNRSNDLFDFVDAGELKENADSKIRAMFRQFVDNSQCRQIYFAGCHDVGYLNELTPHTSIADKITLVRNYAFHHEFGRLGMRVEEFPRVFRSMQLDMQPGTSQNWRTPVAPVTSYNGVPALSQQEQTAMADQQDAKACFFFQKGQCKYGKACKNLHIKTSANGASDITASPSKVPHQINPQLNSTFGHSTARDSPFSKPPDNDFMRGNITVLSGPSPVQNNIDLFTSLPKPNAIPQGKIAVNRDDQRLDAYLPPPSDEDKNLYFKRIAKQKLCNKHHLNGECHDVQCAYDHSPTTAGVRNYLRMVASATPCPRRNGCRNLSCINGHVCQKLDCQRRGGKAYCKFPHPMHTIDINVAGYVDGSRPYHGTADSISVGADGSPPPESEQLSDDEKSLAKGITKNDVAMYLSALRNQTLSTEKVPTTDIDPESDEEKNGYSFEGAKLNLVDEELD